MLPKQPAFCCISVPQCIYFLGWQWKLFKQNFTITTASGCCFLVKLECFTKYVGSSYPFPLVRWTTKVTSGLLEFCSGKCSVSAQFPILRLLKSTCSLSKYNLIIHTLPTDLYSVSQDLNDGFRHLGSPLYKVENSRLPNKNTILI